MIDRLDPRRHFAAAIGWSMLATIVLGALLAAYLASREAEHAARTSTERLMAQFAVQVSHSLGMTMHNRLAILQASAAQIGASGDKGAEALRQNLTAVQVQFPEFAWLGVADVHGKVIAATGGVLEGESVAQRAWFAAARSGPYLGNLYQAVLLEKQLPRAAAGQPLRLIDAAAPIRLEGGNVAGVLGGHLAWSWVDRLVLELLGELAIKRRLELVLADGSGVVVAGPQRWIGRTMKTGDDLSEGGAYIVGRSAAKRVADMGPAWTVVVRQPTGSALDQARRLHHIVFVTVLLAGALASLVALGLTRWLTWRLAALAREATAVRQGRRAAIPVPPGKDEVSHIGATMSELVGHLQSEKAALAQLNAELDARVAERTARIERMADAARYGAVTRERLRLARDLHDTLAHSLVALLTQLRLVRKLKDRLSADEFAAELGRAEEVAASGLADARAAITQMRHGTVREGGLAAALRDLLARFGERTGIAATFLAKGWAVDLADERAETLYRIVEEALHNVERHAQARSVVVEVADDVAARDAPMGGAVERATLTVRDDGVGFDTATRCPGHYGVIGMREQATLIGAELVIRSAPGQGTEIWVNFRA